MKNQVLQKRKKYFIGQCFLIDLNSFAQKNVSHPRSVKKPDKLSAIKLKQKSNLEDNFSFEGNIKILH